jgi:histidinol-phosphatase (PHP family)
MHAIGEDREYVENAIKGGLKVLGFADHAPDFGNINNPLVTGVRMPLSELEGYFYSLTELKREYKNDIDIYIGVENECFSPFFDRDMELLSAYPLDYMLLSSHYLYFGDDESLIHTGHPINDPMLMKKYADETIYAMSLSRFTYFCHPDVINFTGPKEVYVSEMKRIIEASKKYDMPLEYNLLGLRDNRYYPTRLFWETVAMEDVKPKVIIGADAHAPKHVARAWEVNSALQFLGNLGITPINTVEFKNMYK